MQTEYFPLLKEDSWVKIVFEMVCQDCLALMVCPWSQAVAAPGGPPDLHTWWLLGKTLGSFTCFFFFPSWIRRHKLFSKEVSSELGPRSKSMIISSLIIRPQFGKCGFPDHHQPTKLELLSQGEGVTRGQSSALQGSFCFVLFLLVLLISIPVACRVTIKASFLCRNPFLTSLSPQDSLIFSFCRVLVSKPVLCGRTILELSGNSSWSKVVNRDNRTKEFL